MYDVTQADLSEEMDVSAGVLSDYENGRRSNPGIEFVSEYVTAVVSVASGGEADGDDRAGRGGRHRISGEPEAWGHVPGQVPDAIAESVRAAWGGFESG